jgi:hypothetical protein
MRKMARMDTPLTPTTAAQLVGSLADCDHRTAARALRGDVPRGRVGERLARVLREHPELAHYSSTSPSEPPDEAA